MQYEKIHKIHRDKYVFRSRERVHLLAANAVVLPQRKERGGKRREGKKGNKVWADGKQISGYGEPCTDTT